MALIGAHLMADDIRQEAEWVFDRLASAESDTDRAYYQGRVDQLAWINKREQEREGVRA